MSLSRKFKVWWWRTQFDPGVIGILVNPFYFARRNLLSALRQPLSEMRGRVLDVGCGRCPYRAYLHNADYVGADIDTPLTRHLGAADVLYDGERLPFEEGAFDGVLCSQVLEHVFKPQSFLKQLSRVLRPGGQLILTVPFIWDEHEQPYDFGRYSSFGLSSLLREAGFEVVVHRKLGGDATALAQLVGLWIYKLIPQRSRIVATLLQVVLIAPVNVVGFIAGVVLPRNPDFFLDNFVIAKKRGG